MSEDESFVVLGSSPMESLRSERGVDSMKSFCNSLTNSQLKVNTEPGPAYDIKDANKSLKEPLVSTPEKTTSNPTLASSFIMGEINADVLKQTSVYSQLPSTCSMVACAEDVLKLQRLMAEYVELKNTLATVNSTMKQFYAKTQQWREEAQAAEQNNKQQLQSCQAQIAALRNENMELKRAMEGKMEQMKVAEEMRQQETKDLLRALSEKSAQISNMSVQIEKLESQQLASFEYVPRNLDDNSEKPDYVDRLEHQRIVKQFEQQLSELLAENLELKDLQKQYHSEIDCLKVNLTAGEELLKQSRVDIDFLKAKDIEKSQLFTNYESDRDRMREEITLLRQQVEVYSKDFEMERTARQNLAGEKDQLLQDLRALQRKNQTLIEEAQKTLDSFDQSRKSASPVQRVSASPPKPESSTSKAAEDSSLRCPICSLAFPTLTVLSSHVNDCLDKSN